MKQTFKYLLSTVLMLIPVLAFAQSGGEDLPDPDIYNGYKKGGGVATKKTVGDPDANGVYRITLETFATGMTSIISKPIPSDIILLLDYSSSMLMTGSAQPNRAQDTRTRLYDLKNAVGEFVNMMKDNNTTIGLSGDAGNRIAFVLYAGELYSENQDDHQTTSGGTTHGIFHALHLQKWLPVSDLTVDNTLMEHHPVWTNGSAGHDYASSSVLYSGVDILSPKSQRPAANQNLGYNSISPSIDMGDVNKSTNSSAAMEAAGSLVTSRLSSTSLNDRNLVVVLFTDGEPSSGNNFDPDIADDCIAAAHDIKDKDVTVYCIGLLSGSDDTNRTKTYLEYTSSDYSKTRPEGAPNNPRAMPARTATSNLYLDRNGNYGPYCFRVADGGDLSDIFKTIGEASGGSEEKIPGETQVVDVVSNSFEVPKNFQARDVVVYYKEVSSDGKSWGSAVPLSTEEVDAGDNPPMTVEQPETADIGVSIVDGKLTVTGFDYSGPDNWVGWRDETTCAGKELVIEFDVQANADATGGDGTNTNMANSGVYVPVYNDAGTQIIGYTNVNAYDVPHKDLPINLVIKKSGLRHGESATIQIYMSHQKNVGGKIQYHQTTGKPLPEATLDLQPTDDPNDKGWENFTKVILTNLGEDGEDVTKTLLSLDPTYVYLLVEDNWGWAYVLDDKIVSTCEVERNPFEFVNVERTDVPKHAEAVSINHFGQRPHAQNAKSSKGTFDPPATSGSNN